MAAFSLVFASNRLYFVPSGFVPHHHPQRALRHTIELASTVASIFLPPTSPFCQHHHHRVLPSCLNCKTRRFESRNSLGPCRSVVAFEEVLCLEIPNTGLFEPKCAKMYICAYGTVEIESTAPPHSISLYDRRSAKKLPSAGRFFSHSLFCHQELTFCLAYVIFSTYIDDRAKLTPIHLNLTPQPP